MTHPLRAAAPRPPAELAFAARVTEKTELPLEPARGSEAPEHPAEPRPVRLKTEHAVPPPSAAAVPHPPAPRAPEGATPYGMPDPPARPDVAREAPAPESGPALRAQAAAEPPAPAERPTAPARDISIEVARGAGRVEVRMAERAGEIRLAVHAPDSELAGALRERLPELVNRLEDAGFAAETWRPEAPGGARQDGRDGREPGQGFAGGGGAPRDGRHGRQHHGQPPSPAWLEELEEVPERSELEWAPFLTPSPR